MRIFYSKYTRYGWEGNSKWSGYTCVGKRGLHSLCIHVIFSSGDSKNECLQLHADNRGTRCPTLCGAAQHCHVLL